MYPGTPALAVAMYPGTPALPEIVYPQLGGGYTNPGSSRVPGYMAPVRAIAPPIGRGRTPVLAGTVYPGTIVGGEVHIHYYTGSLTPHNS